ncbi:hypothetical protein N657DRAFT_140950 [Parathielavia appendiculata]|uniref:Uncharacterized protein n=1 Tax=Parathielavia appendiculata TaxID=2587402 RepID=A0AAN6Z0W7_9PEZI|nr:hypothetical protein N657DRAFT_140950 [Parathielavia appendiculata]
MVLSWTRCSLGVVSEFWQVCLSSVRSMSIHCLDACSFSCTIAALGRCELPSIDIPWVQCAYICTLSTRLPCAQPIVLSPFLWSVSTVTAVNIRPANAEPACSVRFHKTSPR